MEFWNEIINTALLGTEKKQMATAGFPAPLQEVTATITEHAITDKEEQFLQLAAVSLNFRQSGNKPLHKPTLSFPQAAAEILSYCTPKAASVLKDILIEDSLPLLEFWLHRCVAAQKLASPDLIPILLNKAVNHKQLQSDVSTVCGKRGEWLSRLNPAWEFSPAVDEEQLWLTGTAEQRKAALRLMRRQDPAKAREWLEQTWPQENANARTELLKQLDGTVQLEDEPFLLNQTNEKSQKVKDEAIRLLKQLPDGVLVRKYIELVQPMIGIKKERALLGLKTTTTLEINPPAVPEKGEYIPGIEKLSNDKSFSDGEFVIFQLMQMIPPSFWESYFALPPTEVLGLFTGKNEKYLPAFVQAAVQFRDVKWAEAYLNHREVFYSELLNILPESKQEAYCLRHFKQYAENIVQCALEWPREWSRAMAKEIITHTSKQPYHYNISFYKANIVRFPATVIADLDASGPADANMRPLWINMLDPIRRLLALKERTQNAFTE